MELYFIRHAAAEPLGQKNEFLDEKRKLTVEGRQRMLEAAKGLRKLGVELDLIMSSPHARAFETAEVLASTLDVAKKEIEVTASLAPGASSDGLLAEIKRHSGAESIALVGHQPDLGDSISRIVQGGGALALELKKGGVCCVHVIETVPVMRGNLVWLVAPRHLRMLARS